MFGDFKSDMKQDFLKLKGIGSNSQPPGKKKKKKKNKEEKMKWKNEKMNEKFGAQESLQATSV